MRSIRVALALLIASVLSTIGMMVISPTAHAEDNPSFCDSSVPTVNQSFGAKVPVVLLHGWNGNPGQWQSPNSDIESGINSRSDVAVALNYDYGTTPFYWSVGHEVAKAVDCISLISKQNGGKGKVVLIGYSEGGLVADNADDRDIDGTGRNTADEIGQIITIVTPNTSPNYYPGIMLHTVSVDTRDEYYDHEDGTLELAANRGDDGIFPDSSEVGWETPDASTGGGSTTVTCTVKHFDDTNGTSGSDYGCQHANVLGNSDVKHDVLMALGHYVTSLNAWPNGGSPTELYVDHLKMYFDDKWQLEDIMGGAPGYGAYGPGGDFMATEVSSGNGVYVFSYTAFGCTIVNDLSDCVWQYGDRTGDIQPAWIGGRKSDISFAYDAGADRVGKAWCFTNKTVCVFYTPPSSQVQGGVDPDFAALEVFSNASWY